MTAPTSTAKTIIGSTFDPNTFPYLAPQTTERRMRHFSQDVYNISPNSHLYSLIDALTGDAGAGSLKKELLFSQFNQKLDGIVFRDLDNIFGKIAGLIRYASESYRYDPANQQLTTEEWQEVMAKDSAYRARIRNFMIAIGMGGTPQGFRMMCRAAVGVDCELYEVSHYADSTFYLGRPGTILGRTNNSLRNEVVLRPLKATLSNAESYLLNGLIDHIRPQDTVLTIDINGLPVHTPLRLNNVAASSSYFQVEKNVTGSVDIAKLPPTPVLAADLQLDPSYLWIEPQVTVPAPAGAYQCSQESTVSYCYSYKQTTAIDNVQCGEDDDERHHERPKRRKIEPYCEFDTKTNEGFGPWISWDAADCPQNYPGGKEGQTPFTPPARTRAGFGYNYPYLSQSDFVDKQKVQIIALGGECTDTQYRLPLQKTINTTRRVYTPELAIPLTPPTQTSTVSSQWVRRPVLGTS